jgi:hypothetical protein
MKTRIIAAINKSLAASGRDNDDDFATKYQLRMVLGNYTVSQLHDLLTVEEIAARRAKMGYALRRDDIVNLVINKAVAGGFVPVEPEPINQAERPDLCWTRESAEGCRTTFGKLNDGSVRVTVTDSAGERSFDILSADERRSLISWLQALDGDDSTAAEPETVYHRCGSELQPRPADGWDDGDMATYAFFCPRCSVYTNMSRSA